ncbi:opacity protein-like surface antigen [Herbaspirillum rubrisubalbicans]|nr:opacity protein-like surface antigen [Herbaspirillum rubrisubalbicans]
MMKKMYFLAATTMLLVSSVASAQAVKSDRGFYVGLEGGAANYDIDVERSRNTTEKNDAGMVRLGIGYQFNPNFSLEAGYFRIGETSVEYKDTFTRDGSKARINGFDLIASYKFTGGLPGLYVKGGLTQATVTEDGYNEFRDLGRVSVTNSRETSSGTGYLLGVGYEYDLTKSFSINGGYTRYQSLAGHSNADVNFFSAGLKYRF